MADNYYSGLATSLVSRLISIAASFAVIWAFNQVGRDVYGLYAFAGSVVAIVIVIGCLGLDQLVLFRQSQHREEPRQALLTTSLGKVIRISLILCLIYLLFGYVQVALLEPSASFLVYVALAATIPAATATLVFSAWHQALQDFRRALLIPRSADLLRLLLLIPLGLLLPNLESFLLIIVLSAWIPLGLYRMDLGTIPAGASVLDSADRSYARHMVIIRLVRASVDNIDIIMVGLLTSTDLTAAYALGSRIAAFGLLGNKLLGQVTLPRIGARLGESDHVGMMQEYDRHRWMSLTVALGVTVLLLPFGPRVMGLFGSYTDALPVLYTLLSAHLFACSFGPAGNALKMGGHASILLSSVWKLLALLFVTNLVLIPLYGIVGAAFGTLLSLVAINLLNWWQCYRVYGLWTMGPLAFVVMLASNLGILLFVSGMTVAGLMLLCAVILFTLFRVLQGGQAITGTVGLR